MYGVLLVHGGRVPARTWEGRQEDEAHLDLGRSSLLLASKHIHVQHLSLAARDVLDSSSTNSH